MSDNKEYEESPRQKKEREIESRYGVKPTSPLDLKGTRKAFDIALESMIQKFADCPICQGEFETACPTPQMGYARCPTRRTARKYMRRGVMPRIRRM